MARPSSFKEETAQRILDRLANGEALTAICADSGMPNRTTVIRWQVGNEKFRIAYACARNEGLDVIADEIMRIADEPIPLTPTGNTDNGAVSHQRLRFDARRWYLSKMAPKRYGDKLTVAGDEENPLAVNDQSAAARLATLLAAAEARRARQGDESPEDEPDYSDLI